MVVITGDIEWMFNWDLEWGCRTWYPLIHGYEVDTMDI